MAAMSLGCLDIARALTTIGITSPQEGLVMEMV